MSCLETLEEKGLKLTPQRRLIVDIIHNAGAHITAEDIITTVQKKMPGVNKSTIYRTLDLLEDNGCIFKSEAGDHSIYHHAEEGHHHHLICRQCGMTISCNENIFLPVEKSLNEKYQFQVHFKHMIISGLCHKCTRKPD